MSPPFSLNVPALTVSDEIKTLDFSLPSYDNISSSKASVENVDGLAQEYKPSQATKAPRAKKEKKPDGAPGSNPMAKVLPSMSKGPANKPKAAKSAPASRPPPKEKEERGPVVETMDLSLPSSSGSTAGREKSVFSI